jgi:predicted metalloprotease
MGIRRVVAAAAVALLGAGVFGATAAPAGAADRPDRMDRKEFVKYEASILRDVNEFWRSEFARYGVGYRAAGLAIVSPKGWAKVCGGEILGDPARYEGADPAFYCPKDRTVYLSTGWMYDHIYQRFDSAGAAIVIAHELGHHIQQLVGVTRQVGKHDELQADCLAGNWTRDSWARGRVGWFDLAEAGLTLYDLGDYEEADPGHHGTPKERAHAYSEGVKDGDPTKC